MTSSSPIKNNKNGIVCRSIDNNSPRMIISKIKWVKQMEIVSIKSKTPSSTNAYMEEAYANHD